MEHEGRARRFFAFAQADACGGPGDRPGVAVGREIALPLSEAHHAAGVLRLRAGDVVELFDGAGGRARARLISVRRGAVAAVVETAGPPLARPLPVIRLAFAVPKGSRVDWLLEKATELGVASLSPLALARSVAGGEALSAAKRRRWQGLCIAAAKQSGLDFLPTISDLVPLTDFLAGAKDGLGLYGDLSASAVSVAAAIGQEGRRAATCYIVVGPEGGLTEAERQALNTAGFAPVRLGSSVLRIETAAIALVSAVLALRE